MISVLLLFIFPACLLGEVLLINKMIEKNDKWIEKFTKWITSGIHCHKTDCPTTRWLKTVVIDYFSWFCGLIGCQFLWGHWHVCITLGLTGHCSSAAANLSPDSPTWPPFPFLSRISLLHGVWFLRGDNTIDQFSMYIMLALSLWKNQITWSSPESVWEESPKGVDSGGYGSLEATTGYQDVFEWSNVSILMIHSNNITKHNCEVNK